MSIRPSVRFFSPQRTYGRTDKVSKKVAPTPSPLYEKSDQKGSVVVVIVIKCLAKVELTLM